MDLTKLIFAPCPPCVLELIHAPQHAETPAETPISAPSGFDAALAGTHEKYAQAALQKELETLASTQPGAQNEQLNKSSFSLGTLIGAGILRQSEVEAEIERVVMNWPNESGKPRWTPQNARPTIRSGIDDGKRNPRRLPEPYEAVTPLLRGRSARAWIQGKAPDDMESGAGDEESERASVDEDEKAINTGVYAVLEWPHSTRGAKNAKARKPAATKPRQRHFVCDCSAHIVGEVTDEHGQTFSKSKD